MAYSTVRARSRTTDLERLSRPRTKHLKLVYKLVLWNTDKVCGTVSGGKKNQLTCLSRIAESPIILTPYSLKLKDADNANV
jgi:hypothetical protein